MPYEISGYGFGPEIVGADDELDNILGAMGDGNSYELGASMNRGMMPSQFAKKYQWRPPTRLSNLPLPIPTTTVPASGTATVTLRPQLPFKPYRISTPTVGVNISDFRVGNASQYLATGSIPAECFAPNATEVLLKGDTASPGMEVTLVLENRTSTAVVFNGMLVGDVAHT